MLNLDNELCIAGRHQSRCACVALRSNRVYHVVQQNWSASKQVRLRCFTQQQAMQQYDKLEHRRPCRSRPLCQLSCSKEFKLTALSSG
jgi:hypothetical protein